MRTRYDDDARPDLITIIERFDRLDRWALDYAAHAHEQKPLQETRRRKPTPQRLVFGRIVKRRVPIAPRPDNR